MKSLVITARFAPKTQARLDALRERYFPSELNFLEAHLTVVHQFPEKQSEALSAWFDTACARAAPKAQLTGLRAWKTGFAVHIDCPALVEIHRALVTQFRPFLSPQDTATLSPHTTLQNKTAKDVSASDFVRAKQEFVPETTTIVAIDIWRYENGPWKHLWAQPFEGYSGAIELL